MKKSKRAPLKQLCAAFLHNHARSLVGLTMLIIIGSTLVLGVQWLQDPYRFPLRVVKVEGDFRYLDKRRLQQVMAPHTEGGFFTVNVSSIRDAVEEMPWVYLAAVQRDWPDRLIVKVEEQVPVARWGIDGMLNRHGEPFVPETLPVAPELPWLSGPNGHERTVLEQYRLIANRLAALGLDVTRVQLDERRAWRLEMANGMQLELGRADTRRRLERFVRSFPDVFAGRLDQLQRVDMRYSNGFSVYWQQAEADLDNSNG